MPKRKVDDYYNNIGISSEHYDDDLDEYGRNVNQDESSILDLFKDNVPKSKEGIDKSQPFIPTRASDCPFNPDGRNHEFIKDQNSDVTCKHCGEEVTDYEVKLWGESKASEGEWENELAMDWWKGLSQSEQDEIRKEEPFILSDNDLIVEQYMKRVGESKATEDYDYEPKLDCLNCNGKGCGDCHGTGIYGESKATEHMFDANFDPFPAMNAGGSDVAWRGNKNTSNKNTNDSGWRDPMIRSLYDQWSFDHTGTWQDFIDYALEETDGAYDEQTIKDQSRSFTFESKASEGYVVFTSDGITQERHKEEWEAKDHAELIGGYMQKEISDDDWDLGKHYSISRDGDLGDIVYDARESKATELSPEAQCPKCGSYKTILEGMSSLGYGKRRQYVCTNCYNVFQSEHSPKEIRAMYGDHTSPYDRNRWGESKATESEKLECPNCKEKGGLFESTFAKNGYLCEYCDADITDEAIADWNDVDWLDLDNLLDAKESKYTIEDESDQNDGEIQKDIESELHGEEKYVRGYEHDWKDKLDTWDGRAVSDNFTTVQPYDPVNPKYECIYCGKEFSWDDTFTHDGSHGTLPSPYEDMGNT